MTLYGMTKMAELQAFRQLVLDHIAERPRESRPAIEVRGARIDLHRELDQVDRAMLAITADVPTAAVAEPRAPRARKAASEPAKPRKPRAVLPPQASALDSCMRQLVKA
jgi:hypothetical protein